MWGYVLSGVSSFVGNIRGAIRRSSIVDVTTNKLHINVLHPGYFNANAKDENKTKYTIDWSFLGTRSKPIPPEVKVYVGLLVFCFLTVLVASFIDNQRLAFLCIGLILGGPLVLALADTFYPLEEDPQ